MTDERCGRLICDARGFTLGSCAHLTGHTYPHRAAVDLADEHGAPVEVDVEWPT